MAGGGGGGYFARKSYRTGTVRADNTADFIYSSRLLLSCDLTAARANGARRYRGEREKEESGRRDDGG